MKKISIIYLMSAVVLLGSCAREYPTFNQMPTNAYQNQKVQEAHSETPVVEVAVEKPALEIAKIEILSSNPEVVKMLAENSPRQIDDQLARALATTQGQSLMAKPLVAAQIDKARKLIAKNELRNAPLSDVQTSKASKLINQTLKNHMEQSALAPATAKAAQELNRYIKIGLILLLAGVVLTLIPGIRWLGGIAGLAGVIFIVLGLLEM